MKLLTILFCNCFECSCWGGNSVVCWSAIIVVRCGCLRDVNCIATSGVGCVVCCYLAFVSCNALNTGFCVCVSVFVSFICMLCLRILYMWYFSSVYKSFLCVLMMSMVSVMVPYLCPVFNTWFEYPQLLLFLNACIFSLYLVWNALSVCPRTRTPK
jgi:hypothetical protein